MTRSSDQASNPAYLFDAYGTLFDVHSAVGRHAKALGEAASSVSAIWRERQLQYSWVRALAGDYRDFDRITREALDHALAMHGLSDEAWRKRLLGAYQALDAYADVAPALEWIRSRGGRTAVFSNATPRMLEDGLAHAALTGLFDHVVSVDPTATYKPIGEAYVHAERTLGVAPTDIRFFSSNAWDVFGARTRGWNAFWVNRDKRPSEYGIGQDDAFDSLEAAVRHAAAP